jgi:hypothetical protein
MALFSTDFKIQAIKILQPVLRGVLEITDFLKVAANQINAYAGTNMLTFENRILLEAKYNGQIIVLRNALNQYFAVSGIYVLTNASQANFLFVANDPELLPVYFGNASEGRPVYVANLAEISLPIYDYTVYIPVGIYTTELNRRIISVVKLFSIAGKNFNTVTY